jgi:hypothetical protein
MGALKVAAKEKEEEELIIEKVKESSTLVR